VKIHILFIRDDGEISYEGIRWEDHLEKWLSLIPPRQRYTEVTGIVDTIRPTFLIRAVECA
jgi:hypothetical protein